jgi:YD repeat-containing protein
MSGGFGRRSAALAMLAVALVAAGCAHAPTAPPLDSHSVRERYGAALKRREAGALALEAEAALWLENDRGRKLPGVLAEIELAAPDRLRIRVRAPLGTLLDVSGQGEEIVAWLPARGAACELAASGDSLGFAHPVALAACIFAALWHPPAEIWSPASWSGREVDLSWREGGRGLRLRVDRDGLPTTVEIRDEEGGTVRVEYDAWARRGHARWPGRIRVEDAGTHRGLVCRIERVRLRPSIEASRFTVRIPGSARRLEYRALLQSLESAATP